MYFLLRFSLAGLFVAVGALFLFYPDAAYKYIDLRYDGLKRFAYTSLSLRLPLKPPFLSYSYWNMFGFLFCSLGAFCVAIKFRLGIMLYAFLTVFVGGLLHLPYTNADLKDIGISQIRRLVWVFVIFGSLTILAAQCKKTNNTNIAGLSNVCVINGSKPLLKESPKEKPKGE